MILGVLTGYDSMNMESLGFGFPLSTLTSCAWPGVTFQKERDFNQKEELQSGLHRSVYSKCKY